MKLLASALAVIPAAWLAFTFVSAHGNVGSRNGYRRCVDSR